MIGRINLPSTLIIDSSDATASAEDILFDKTAYVNAEKITGTMPNNGTKIITPNNTEQVLDKGYYESITVNKGADSSSATATNENILVGKTAYVNNAEVTGTMPNYGNKVITPSTSIQEFEGGYYESVKVEPGIDTSDANATQSDILAGKSAYVNGVKVEGSMVNRGKKVITPSDNVQTFDGGYYESIQVEKQKGGIDIQGIIEEYKVSANRKCKCRRFCYVL